MVCMAVRIRNTALGSSASLFGSPLAPSGKWLEGGTEFWTRRVLSAYPASVSPLAGTDREAAPPGVTSIAPVLPPLALSFRDGNWYQRSSLPASPFPWPLCPDHLQGIRQPTDLPRLQVPRGPHGSPG